LKIQVGLFVGWGGKFDDPILLFLILPFPAVSGNMVATTISTGLFGFGLSAFVRGTVTGGWSVVGFAFVSSVIGFALVFPFTFGRGTGARRRGWCFGSPPSTKIGLREASTTWSLSFAIVASSIRVGGAVVADSFGGALFEIVQLEMRVTLETAVSIKFYNFCEGEVAVE
jgi:hypothetical protein